MRASAGTSTTKGCSRAVGFFRPGYAANLVGSWLPALNSVEAKLNVGAKVADVGCSHGASTTLMAHTFQLAFSGVWYSRRVDPPGA